MMKKFYSVLFLSFFLLVAKQAFTQRQDNSTPVSWRFNHDEKQAIHLITIPKPEIKSLPESHEKAFQFAEEVNLVEDFFALANKQKLGNWNVYQLEISAPEAKSVSLNFTKFKTSKNGKLWVFHPENLNLRGGYHSSLNKNSETFAIAPIKGNRLVIEYAEPLDEPFEAEIVIQSVMYGFEDVFGWMQTRNFGSSGSCNININCPDGDDWQLHKRSVAMILTANNSRICTGALINNNANDGTPYFLTAKHCNVQINAIVMFNYESPDCGNIDGNTMQTVQGCEKVAEWAPSDFTLLKLLDTPPVEYTTYFSGWSAVPEPKFSAVTIHHPRGDIKKISSDENQLDIAVYSGVDTTRNHWKINTWEKGTTEPGSSGSPLFDANKRIIGQLHGGMATCANSINDYYGMFYYSWTGGGQPENSLQPWLDPDNTGTLVNDGYNPNISLFDNDLSITKAILQENNTCEAMVYPVFLVSNLGNNAVQRFKISCAGMEVDTTLTILPFNTKPIPFKGIPLKIGNNQLIAEVKLIAPAPDQFPVNDTIKFTVIRNAGERVRIIINTDNFGSETSWELFDADNQLVANGNGYAGNQTYEHKLCLTPGCYNFTIYDSDGDGMCCTGGDGSYQIIDKKGNILASGGSFQSSETKQICVPFYTQNFEDVAVFPNPAVSELNVLISGQVAGKEGSIAISDMQGKVVYNYSGKLKYLNNFDVSNLSSGVYGIKIVSGEFIRKKKFVKL